jgi:hypothetical protein
LAISLHCIGRGSSARRAAIQPAASRRHGLRDVRRWLGPAGLSAAALFLAAATVAPNGNLALVFLSCACGGIPFQQPSMLALCPDIGRNNGGAVFGFMNTAANAAASCLPWSLGTS